VLIDAKKYPDEDAVMTAAMDAEADDFQKVEDHYEITCHPAKFNSLQDALLKAEYELVEADVKNIPKAYQEVDLELGKKLAKIIDKFDENEDVQNVYTTAHLTDEMLAG
jgi:transcriptional/translational regulatory protein YebC/TACO1